MNLPEQRSDEDLANLLSQGDASASATLAQRYAPGIYDFAIRITLDPASAANVTESSLNRASAEIKTRPQSLSFRAWLYGIARDESLEGLRQRARGEAGSEDMPATVLSPMDARFVRVRDADLTDAAGWAWSSARGQRPRDYSILDLLLRRRITAEEVAEIASLSRNGVYAVLGRLRGGFEESFVATALYASGRSECHDLDALLGDTISLGPALRREVSRHAESCAICKETRASLPAAADVFAGLDDVEIPDDLSDRLLPLMLAAGSSALGAVASQAEDAGESSLAGGAVAAAAGAAALTGVAAGFASNGDEAPEPATDALDAEANSTVTEEEAPAISQASLFESEADTTESEVEIAEQSVADEEPEPITAEAAEDVESLEPAVIDAELEPEAPLEVPESEVLAEDAETPDEEAAEDEADASAATVIEDMIEADEEPEESEPAAEPESEPVPESDSEDDSILPEAAAGLAAGAVVAHLANQDDEPVASAEEADIAEVAAAGSLPRPSYIQGSDEPDTPYDVYAEEALSLDDNADTQGNLDGDVAYDEDNAPNAELLAELDQADEAELQPQADEDDDDGLAVAPLSVAEFGWPERSDTEDSLGAAAAAGPFAGAGMAAAAGTRRRGRGLQGAGGAGSPPSSRSPFETAEDDDRPGGSKKKYFVYAIIAGISLVALYLGIALGDSIRGGGGGGGTSAATLPTRASGVADVACPGPVQVNPGSRVALAFANIPTGFTLQANPEVRPTNGAQAGLLSATSQQGNTILVIAGSTQSTAGRTDEYQVTATFANGDQREQYPCIVRVGAAAPPPTATATQPATTPTAEATETPAPIPPTATSVPIIQPTPIPTAVPTETPDLSTPTPDLSTATPIPVATGVIISPTETATPEPPTATPAP